jgi:hypothetical protein
MKFRSIIVAGILLAAGCAPRQPPVIQPPPLSQPPVIQQPPVSQQPPVNQQPSGLSDTPKSQINKDRDRDLSECERESAFAGVGEKRRVFDKCMKARGY